MGSADACGWPGRRSMSSAGYLPLSSEYVSGLSVLSRLSLKHNSLKFVPAVQVIPNQH